MYHTSTTPTRKIIAPDESDSLHFLILYLACWNLLEKTHTNEQSGSTVNSWSPGQLDPQYFMLVLVLIISQHFHSTQSVFQNLLCFKYPWFQPNFWPVTSYWIILTFWSLSVSQCPITILYVHPSLPPFLQSQKRRFFSSRPNFPFDAWLYSLS